MESTVLFTGQDEEYGGSKLMDGEITKISEVKILIYLLGLLRIHEKRKTAKILWRNGFEVIRMDISNILAALLLSSHVKRLIPYRYESLSHDKRFHITDLSI